MLQINGKTFMNLQEAVQWLLDNNALPFQSSANYVANTEIGMGTIVNPSPAKVRIGSLIFFADSKVSTVTGLTENGFIVSDQYNDLVDDVVYVSNVAINGSGHLIVTLSNGDNIDAGLIKQVSSFSINASQHLIVSYNDGTSADLGAIFAGDVNISGNLTATHAKLFENIEDSNGRKRFIQGNGNIFTFTGLSNTYCKWSLSGSHLIMVFAGKIDNGTALTGALWASFDLPSWIISKIYPVYANNIEQRTVKMYASDWSTQDIEVMLQKDGVYNQMKIFYLYGGTPLTADRGFRIEFDLLIDND